LASPDEALEVVTKIMNQAERLDDLTGQELLVIIKQVSYHILMANLNVVFTAGTC